MLTKILNITNYVTEIVSSNAETANNANSFLETIKYLNDFGVWDFWAIVCSGIISIVIMFITLHKDKKMFIDERERANRIYLKDKLDAEEINRISIMPYFIIEKIDFSQKELSIIFEITFKNLGNGTAINFAPNGSDINYGFELINTDPNESIRPNAKSKTIQMICKSQKKTEKITPKTISFSIKYKDMKGRIYFQRVFILVDLITNTNNKLTTYINYQNISDPLFGIEL